MLLHCNDLAKTLPQRFAVTSPQVPHLPDLIDKLECEINHKLHLYENSAPVKAPTPDPFNTLPVIGVCQPLLSDDQKLIQSLRAAKRRYKRMASNLKSVLRERDQELAHLRDQALRMPAVFDERDALAIQCHELQSRAQDLNAELTQAQLQHSAEIRQM